MWQRRIPLQALEAAWGLGVLAGACGLWNRRSFDGALLLYALGAYGAGRILLESLRDETDRVGGMSVHRAISTGFVAVALGAGGRVAQAIFASSGWPGRALQPSEGSRG
jgi:prolipoprotein diacylglyceryltransferase